VRPRLCVASKKYQQRSHPTIKPIIWLEAKNKTNMTPKKLSEMTLDELYAEEKKLNDTYLNPKTLTASLSIMGLSILLAIYAMKDGFSYFLMGLILLMIYLVLQKFFYKNQIIKEIKSRR
jgi:Ca2+/Na+ antiporter